ncbi:MAG: hypothetical protein DHS20C15_09940 [Planctomycetota bacterium]|nr:MAG: hypothetical protein DHS20C15_09940 [Planctomycetota bacterium]
MALLLGGAWWLLEGDAEISGNSGGGSLRAPSTSPEIAATLPETSATPASSEQPTPLEPAPTPPHAAPKPSTARLAGRVSRLADGAPLVGWTLRTPRRDASPGGATDGPVRLQTSTDDSGRFVFEAAPLELERLELSSPRQVKLRGSFELPLPDDAYERELDLIADTGWILEGTLRSAAGLALRDPLVVGALGASVVPDANGRFRLEDVGPRALEPGLFDLEFGAELHERVTRTLSLRDDLRVVRDLNVELRAAGAIEGRVLGADGYAYDVELVSLPLRFTDAGPRAVSPALHSGPMVAVSSFMMPLRGPGEVVSEHTLTATDDPVHYRVDSVPPGRYSLRVQPEVRDVTHVYASQLQATRGLGDTPYSAPELWLREVTVRAGEVTRLDIHLPWGAGLRGRVLDALGAGLPDARVELLQQLRWQHDSDIGLFVHSDDDLVLTQRSHPNGSGSEALLEITLASAITDADGEFGLGSLPPGEVLVRVTAPDGHSLLTLERALQLESQRTRSANFALERGFEISGRVLDTQGLPLPDARVAAKRPSNSVIIMGDDLVAVDVHGRFVIGGLEAGEWALHVSAPGHIDLTHRLDTGDAPVDLLLERARALKLRVLNAYDGAPVSTYALVVNAGFSYSKRTVSTPDGRFLIDALNPTPVSLTVSAEGFEPTTLDDVQPEATPIEDLREIELRLTPLN